MSGKPCYVLTITDNVHQDDVKIIDDPDAPEKKQEAPSLEPANKPNPNSISLPLADAENENTILSGF